MPAPATSCHWKKETIPYGMFYYDFKNVDNVFLDMYNHERNIWEILRNMVKERRIQYLVFSVSY